MVRVQNLERVMWNFRRQYLSFSTLCRLLWTVILSTFSEGTTMTTCTNLQTPTQSCSSKKLHALCHTVIVHKVKSPTLSHSLFSDLCRALYKCERNNTVTTPNHRSALTISHSLPKLLSCNSKALQRRSTRSQYALCKTQCSN